ncbi:alkaline shock response membrane anchor protein AmaP [Frankia sp. Cr2]|uniref:alkaline shock response membrane anchor protein AmaP n=1 Tax=Frankia sp. Cr2 TaxID=3073932 RepID=UPI002AD327A3|nr:alkaline shock response membrane anchor protein AmaP [Frankia sp. Cr2]
MSTAKPAGSANVPRARKRPFTPAVDQVNRVVFVLLGLVCLGGGLVALLAGRGVFGDDVTDRPGLTAANRAFAADHAWFWPVVGAATALVVVLALAWLWLQRSTGELTGLDVVDDTFGRVRVNARAFTGAVESELAATSGARQIRARLLGKEKHPLLRVVVTMEPNISVSRLRADIEQVVLPHARGALSRADLATEVQLVPSSGHGARVH